MSLKVNVSLSKKVGDPNYGSHGAMVSLEAEIDASLINDPAKFRERLRALFGLVRVSLTDELQGNGTGAVVPATSNGHCQVEPQTGNAPASAANPAMNGNAPRMATLSQIKAIYCIAKRFNIDLWALLRERFQRSRAEDLTLREASQLIDELKGAATVS